MSQFYDEGLEDEELKKEYLKLNTHCKFKNAEELQLKIDEYFELCNEKRRPYTISGLAIFLDITTSTLRNYEKVYGTTDYAEIISKAKQRIEEFAECSLYDNRKTAGAKYVLENNFQWSNKQDVNLSGEISQIVKLEDVL